MDSVWCNVSGREHRQERHRTHPSPQVIAPFNSKGKWNFSPTGNMRFSMDLRG